MTDFVLDFQSASNLLPMATQIGPAFVTQSYTDTQGVTHPATVNLQGPLPDGSGSYFMDVPGVVSIPTGSTTTDSNGNIIPVMAPISGSYFARIRLNGTNVFATGQLVIPPGLIVYTLVTPAGGGASFWTKDGTTAAPAYVAGIGVIA